MNEPILKTVNFNDGRKGFAEIVGGLHYLKGNSAPYFSITTCAWYGKTKSTRNEAFFGCNHEFVAEHAPEFEDLIALHLSDIDGVPMHAVENGWYWLAGAVKGHYGERYHGGNSKGRHGGEYREPTREECLEILARHLRISYEEAAQLAATIVVEPIDEHLHIGMTVEQIDELAAAAKNEAKAKFAAFVDAQKPRWKKEADAAVKKHGLKVYGAKWEGR